MNTSHYLRIGLLAARVKLEELYDKNVVMPPRESIFDKQEYIPNDKAEIIWEALLELNNMIKEIEVTK